MLESERKKLFDRKEGDYLSIGISEGGEHYNKYRVFWRYKVNALNMKLPDFYLAPEDLCDEEIMSQLAKHTVIGCYINTPLQDYSFLSRFPKIRDLNIARGENIKSLDFISVIEECRMLFLSDAVLENIDVLWDMNANRESFFEKLTNVALFNCEVEDLSVFEREGYSFLEFSVWSAKQDRSKWEKVKATKWGYFELRPLSLEDNSQ